MAADVRLRLRGLMVERFLQRALSEGIELLDVRRVGPREAEMAASERDADKLLHLAERFGLDLRVEQRRWPVRVKNRLKNRLSLPLSVLLAMLLLSLFMSRLWLIELPEDVDPAIARALTDLGIRPGLSLSAIDTRAIEQGLHKLTGQYAFVGARLDGVRLKITTVKELPEPDLFDISGRRDLFASRDAVLLTLNAFAGEPAAKPGDTVRRGQLLIKGEEKISDEVNHSVCALGEAVGRVWIHAEAQGALDFEERVPTGQFSLESELRLFDYALPLLRGQRFEGEMTHIERLPVGGLFLPLNIVRTRHIETELRRQRMDPEALKASLAEQALNDALRKLPAGAEIVDKWIDYSMIEGEQIRARAVIEVHMNIAVSRSALATGGN